MSKLVISLILVWFVENRARNLQFSHFVPGYVLHQPSEENYGYEPFLNPFDPNVPSSFSTGIGGNLNGPQLIADCQPPLVMLFGACRCPGNGRYINGFCFGSDITIRQDQIDQSSNPPSNDQNQESNPSLRSEEGENQYPPTNSDPSSENSSESASGANEGSNQTHDPVFSLNNPQQILPSKISELSGFFRQYNGTNNNILNPNWGATGSELSRKAPAEYKDGISQPIDTRPPARQLSNQIGHVDSITHSKNITLGFVLFGQFIDHDVDLTRVGTESMNIEIPAGDSFFTNQTQLAFERSRFIEGTPRKHENFITSWVDGSQVYGSDEIVARDLRLFSQGKLRTDDNLLPMRNGFFVAGDSRVNENVILTSLHTIFVLQHNRICDEIVTENQGLSDEEIYRAARNYVIGLLQKITLEDFVPIMLGQKYEEIVGTYKGYKPEILPNIPTEFSTAAFRIGHVLLVDKLQTAKKNGEVNEFTLGEFFFRPDILDTQFLSDIFRGLAISTMKEKSVRMANSVRNLLVRDPSNRQIKLDLFSINVQRGRDHGLPNYNAARVAFGLIPITTFDEIVQPQIAEQMLRLYGSVNNLDLWVGIVSEKSVPGGVLGELGAKIVGQTFRDLRDADRFWYQNIYPASIIKDIKETTLSDIVKRNTNIETLPDNIFVI